jgi:hypothetical protein
MNGRLVQTFAVVVMVLLASVAVKPARKASPAESLAFLNKTPAI